MTSFWLAENDEVTESNYELNLGFETRAEKGGVSNLKR